MRWREYGSLGRYLPYVIFKSFCNSRLNSALFHSAKLYCEVCTLLVGSMEDPQIKK